MELVVIVLSLSFLLITVIKDRRDYLRHFNKKSS